jgi:acetyl esterase
MAGDRVAGGLHPEAAALMMRAGVAAEPPFESAPVSLVRAAADARVAATNLSTALVKDIVRLTIPGPGGSLPLRLYIPDVNGAGALGTILFFHGGGWTVGNLDTHDATFRAFARESRCVVVAPDFRLAPEHKFPAAYEDCWATALWVVENVARFGGDPQRVALVGESSGGTLAAAVAQTAAINGRMRIALQILIYPAMDLAAGTDSYKRYADGYLLTAAKLRWFIGNYLTSAADAADWRASPLRAANLTGLPRTLIITAQFDPLVDEAEAYAQRLAAAGIDVDYVCFEGWPHGFVFWPQTEAYAQMMARSVAALARMV